MNIENIVNECLEKYIGGERYFDELDYKLKSNGSLLSELMYKAAKENPECKFVASGEIAKMLIKNGHHIDLILPGGLRFNDQICGVPLDQNHTDYNCKWIFVDDSYYSGKTKRVVEKFIHGFNGELVATYVMYDGSVDKDDYVYSFYRYYDHH